MKARKKAKAARMRESTEYYDGRADAIESTFLSPPVITPRLVDHRLVAKSDVPLALPLKIVVREGLATSTSPSHTGLIRSHSPQFILSRPDTKSIIGNESWESPTAAKIMPARLVLHCGSNYDGKYFRFDAPR